MDDRPSGVRGTMNPFSSGIAAYPSDHVETRRILLDGSAVPVTRDGDELFAEDGRRIAANAAQHLSPVEPSKIVCVHLNYEGEIAIVIGRETTHIAPGDAGDHILGYTVANDFGLHDFRDTDAGSMLRVKGSDTLCPLGPGLVTDWDFHGKRIQTRVNGEVRQDGNTDEMIWDMHYLVADIARTITLLPGDLLLSGTPANSRPVQPGDVVEVEVEGLGTLRNTIIEGDVPLRDDVGAQPSESEEVVSTAFGGDWEYRGIRPPRRG